MKETYRLPMNLQLFAEGEEPQTVNAEQVEVAAPQETEQTEPVVDSGNESESETLAPVVEEPQSKQTPEQDAAFAQLRREKEAAEKQSKQMNEFIQQNYGHLGITTMDQLQTYQKQQQEDDYRQQWEEQGFDPDQVNELINNSPVMREAQTLLQQTREKSAISELTSAHPDLKVNTLEDIVKLPNADQIIDRVQKGYSLKDSYELANQADIMQKKIEAAVQAQLNNINSKNHMKPNAGENGDNIDSTVIPQETLAMYKRLNPGLSDQQYFEHYKKSLGG